MFNEIINIYLPVIDLLSVEERLVRRKRWKSIPDTIKTMNQDRTQAMLMVIVVPRTPSSAALLEIWNHDQIFNLLISQKVPNGRLLSFSK